MSRLQRGLVVFFGLLIGFTPAVAQKKRAPRRQKVRGTVVRYEGRLADLKGRSISGIYRIDFALYGVVKGGTPLWRESHYIAVVNGRYVARLGRERAIPRRVLEMKQLFLGVGIDGHEFREMLTLVNESPAPITAKQPDPGRQKPSSETVKLALNAQRLEGMSVAELIAKIKRELLISKVTLVYTDAHRTPQLGGPSPALEKQVNCRQNYVMTGLRVRAGKSIDTIEAICTRIK
ncbi:MAG: hypothetical protein KC609_14695 [Myxococcales bacterium]|nr:hypothetical protein [Myxococcales bacterium]